MSLPSVVLEGRHRPEWQLNRSVGLSMKPKTVSAGALLVYSTCLLSVIAQARGILVSGALSNGGGMSLTNVALRTESGLVALSDGQGRYQFRVPSGWSGTVTVEQAGWAFTPASRSYTNLTGEVSGQDFTGTPDRPALGVSLSNGVPWLSWMAQTGQTYRVEVSRDLQRWDVLGEPMRVATNPAMRAVELEGYGRWFARLAQPGRTYQVATGQVVLPPGSGWDLASLQVLGGQNASGVTAAGGFSVFQPGSGPALVALVASNQPVLLGYVGAPGGGVSAGSTANWLLFQAVGGYRLPPSTWAQVLGLIDASPEAQALAGVIRAGVATNPLALVQGEAAISNALWVAAGTLVKSHGSPVPLGRSPRHDPEELQAGSLVIEGPYPAAQTGLRCEHNPAGAGLVLVNDYRRHLMYFVYRVGYEDAQGVVHELPAWERVKGINDYLPGVNAVDGVLSSLAGVMMGQVAYGPSVSAEIRLTVQPEDARKVFYRIVATGPAGEVSVPEVLRTHPLRGEWDRAYQWMEGLEFAKEYFVPVVFAGLEVGNMGEALKGRWQLGIELADTLSAAGLDIGTALRAHQYDDALKTVVKELVTNEDLREGVVRLGVRWGVIHATEAQAEALLKHVARILKIADAVVLGFDLAMVSDHILRSYPLVYWDVTVLPPRVELEASERAANAQEPVSLTATVTPLPDLTNSLVKFHWQTSGQGRLRYQAGVMVKEGTDFEVVVTNGSCTVSYQNRSNATHGATEAVRVAVKRVDVSVEGTREVLVGEATNELFVINVQASLKPAETNLLAGEAAVLALKLEPPQPKGLSNLVYTWTLDGSSGSLSGAEDLRRTYTASATGWDVLKAKVKGDFGGKTYDLAEAKADLKVVPVRVSVRPQGQVMGQDRVLTLTAKVEPEPAEGQVVYRWVNVGPAGELLGGNDQETTWPTNQFRSSATVEGTNRITVTAYLVTATETNQLGQARTVIVVQRSLAIPGAIDAFVVVGGRDNAGAPALVFSSHWDRLNYDLFPGDGTVMGPFPLSLRNFACLIAGDWNSDGREDFAGVSWDGHLRFECWNRTAEGGFTLGSVVEGTDPGTGIVAVGDLDGDGDTDLCGVSKRMMWDAEWEDWLVEHMCLARFFNNGQGQFTQAPDIELPWQYYRGIRGLVLADANRDGRLDIILGCSVNWQSPYDQYNGHHLLLFTNTGGGNFSGPIRQSLAEPWGANILQAADLNGDAAADLLVRAGFMSNDGRGHYPTLIPYDADLPPPHEGWPEMVNSVSAGDLDGDGHPDLLLGRGDGGCMDPPECPYAWILVRRNQGDGSFGPPQKFLENQLYRPRAELLDVDRDGDLDALVFDELGNRILLNNGDGTF